jgi:hypothetical protein
MNILTTKNQSCCILDILIRDFFENRILIRDLEQEASPNWIFSKYTSVTNEINIPQNPTSCSHINYQEEANPKHPIKSMSSHNIMNLYVYNYNKLVV